MKYSAPSVGRAASEACGEDAAEEPATKNSRPSRTAYKVAMGVVTLGAESGMKRVLPPGIVAATDRLLVASRAAPAWAVRWARSPKMVSVYEAFDWMLPGSSRPWPTARHSVRRRCGTGSVLERTRFSCWEPGTIRWDGGCRQSFRTWISSRSTSPPQPGSKREESRGWGAGTIST